MQAITPNSTVNVNVDQLNALKATLAQADVKLNLEPELLLQMVFQNIAVSKGSAQPTVGQVIEVIKTAVNMGLDPTGRDLFAYVNKKGQLIVGVSQSGWERAVEIKHGSISYKFSQPIIDPQTHKSTLLWAQCVIKRQDGSVVEGKPVFLDEFAQENPMWGKMPKHMLLVRAFTTAAKSAYGFGAYSIEEARNIYDEEQKSKPMENVKQLDIPQPQPEQLPLLTDKEFETLAADLKAVSSLQNLRTKYVSLAPNARADKRILELCKELSNNFKAEDK